jgi:hypothetical protein
MGVSQASGFRAPACRVEEFRSFLHDSLPTLRLLYHMLLSQRVVPVQHSLA